MKKIIIMLAIISLCMYYFKFNKNEVVTIPNEAIRFRVLANSNSLEDQNIKKNISDKMKYELYNKLKDTKNINEARSVINDNMDDFDTLLKNEMKNKPYSYTIDYGIHTFPKKEYKGAVYKEGNYESLLVTLGKGEGDNFWCVLFPPLCITEVEETNKNDVEYKFFIKEILDKYF